MSEVLALWRYPVKSMQGEMLADAEIDQRGIVGDRTWAVVDAETRIALTGRREPRLLLAAAAIVEGELRVTLPDGTLTCADDRLTEWLGREVRLERAADDTVGTYEIGLADDDDADRDPAVEWVQWQGPAGRFHDSSRTQISIIGVDSVRDWAMRRFRPNVVVTGCDEDEWVGSTARLGAVDLDVVKLIDRCVMTTRRQPGGIERDLDVLRTINRERGGNLGVGALVRAPGTVRVGDGVRVT